MTTVLVTGATGFVGRAVLPLLVAAGYEVDAVHHSGPAPDVPGVRAHRCDLFDPASTEKLVVGTRPELLLHLAWDTVPGRFWSSDENLRWVEASVRLMRAFAVTGGRRAVLAGTCAEYGPAPGICSEESTPLRPDTLYGASKDALRRVVEAHAREAGYGFAWARIFYPFGPGERRERLVPSVIRDLLAGRPVEIREPEQILDLLAVEDLAAAFVALLSSGVQGAVNVGSGHATPVRRLATAIAEITGRGELLRFGEGRGRRVLVAHPRRLQEEVGWSPAGSLEDGLTAAVEWWRAQPEPKSG